MRSKGIWVHGRWESFVRPCRRSLDHLQPRSSPASSATTKDELKRGHKRGGQWRAPSFMLRLQFLIKARVSTAAHRRALPYTTHLKPRSSRHRRVYSSRNDRKNVTTLPPSPHSPAGSSVRDWCCCQHTFYPVRPAEHTEDR